MLQNIKCVLWKLSEGSRRLNVWTIQDLIIKIFSSCVRWNIFGRIWQCTAVLGWVAGIVINISNWPLTWHSLHRVTALVCPVLQSHVIVSVSASCQYQVTTGTGCSGQWWSLTIISDSLIIIVTFYLPTFLIIIILPITSRTGHLQQQKYLIRISGVLPPPVGKYLVQCRNIIVTDSARADDWSC